MTQRMDRLRKARNINEIVAILKEIGASIKKLGKKADLMSSSVSSVRRGRATSAAITETEHEVDRSGKAEPVIPKNRKLDDYKAPQVQDLIKHNKVISELYENSMQLKEAIYLMEQGFEGAKNKGAAIKAAKLLYKEVDDKIAKAFSAMHDLADHHMPPIMTKLGDQIQSYLIDSLEKTRYDEIDNISYVSKGKDGEWLFSFYNFITNLKSDKGFHFKAYYIVLTGVVKDNVITLYLNHLPDFRMPGRYPLGRKVAANIKTLERTIDEFFAHNDVELELEHKAMPVSNERIKTSGLQNIPGVHDVEMSEDCVWVTLKGNATDAKIKLIVEPVLGRLTDLIGNKNRNGKIAYKPLKGLDKGNKVLQFKLVGATTKSQKLNVQHLRDIQAMLHLTDKQVEYIREAQRHVE